MESINIPEALKQLQQNKADIERLGHEIEQAYHSHTLALAALMDAEDTARCDYFATKPCKISELRDWLKMRTHQEAKNEHLKAAHLKTLKHQLQIVTEVNNNLKAAIKLNEAEMRNFKT